MTFIFINSLTFSSDYDTIYHLLQGTSTVNTYLSEDYLHHLITLV